MTDKLIYAKAFAKALADHLRGRTHAFTDFRQGQGGCETCGYGASEYEVLDMNRLDEEIDNFAKSFEESKS